MNERLQQPDGYVSVSSASRQREQISNTQPGDDLNWEGCNYTPLLDIIGKRVNVFFFLCAVNSGNNKRSLCFFVFRAQHGRDTHCGHAGGRGGHRRGHLQGRVRHRQSGYLCRSHFINSLSSCMVGLLIYKTLCRHKILNYHKETKTLWIKETLNS